LRQYFYGYFSLWLSLACLLFLGSYTPLPAVLPLVFAVPFMAFVFLPPTTFNLLRWYHTCSGLAALLMAVAVVLAIW
jgi:hypothetical protein